MALASRSAWRRPALAREGRAPIAGRAIYVLPTRRGLLFATVAVLVGIGASNYQNSLAYALAFLMASVGLVSAVHAWRNLTGLELRLRPPAPSFCGRRAAVPLTLTAADGRARAPVSIQCRTAALVLEVGRAGAAAVLQLPTVRRGRHRIGPVVVSTHYPLGLFRAWAPLDFATPFLVYPRPAAACAAAPCDAAARHGSDSGDFAGLRGYRPGDPLRRVHWKLAARQGTLHTKEFASATEIIRFDWAQVPGGDVERRLSRLTRDLLDATAAGRTWALQLPQARLGPGAGAAHLHRGLRLLALHGAADGDG